MASATLESETRPKLERALPLIVIVGLLLLPLLLALAWGMYLADEQYIPLHYAQNLAVGKGLAGFVGEMPTIRSPLWTAVLTLAALLHFPLTSTALVLSALGWGVAAVLLYQIASRHQMSLSLALVPALLLTLNPVVISTLGSEFPWLIVLALWALRYPAVLPLLPLAYFDWPTAVFCIAWLSWHIWRRQSFPVFAFMGLLLTTAVWAFGHWRLFGRWPTLAVSSIPVTAVIIPSLLLLLAYTLPWLYELWRKNWQGPTPQTAVSLALLIGVPLWLGQSYWLWQQYSLRAPDYQQLQRQVANWLREETEADALIFGSAQVGYMAQRPLWYWSGQHSDEALLPDLLTLFVQRPPDVFVTTRSLPWGQLTRLEWFRERYHASTRFYSAYDVRSPFTIWTYQESAYDLSAIQPTQVQAAEGPKLVAYQYGPPQIAPNEAVYVTLYWEATWPMTTTFSTVLRLVSPLDQLAWAQRDLESPRSVAPGWLESGDWFAERFVLTTTAEIPVGGYELNLSLYQPRSDDFTPLYVGEDANGLDRVILGYTAVPWRGNMNAAVPTEATFGEQIMLRGYELDGELLPGSPLAMTLYWAALRPPAENYTVFVHLLAEDGQLVTNHDGPPFNGRYPSRAWQPGSTIPDEHPLNLPADLPPGRYTINVGLYLPATGERLPVMDAAGNELPDQAFTLQTFTVGEE